MSNIATAMVRRYGCCLSAFLLLMGLGCRRTVPLPQYEQGTSLFPTDSGLSWTYLVRETTYTTTGALPHSYYLRLHIDSAVIDAYGRPSRYAVWDTAPFTDSSRWGFFRVGLIYRDEKQAELWENNTRLLMLRFPLSPDLQWNRYEYASHPREICRYAHLDTAWQIFDKSYPHSVWVVRRADTTALLERAYFYEAYQRGRGLIHVRERYDKFDLDNNGSLVRNTDSYYRELLLLDR